MINGGRVCYYFLQISYSLFFTISRCSRKPMSAHIPKYFWQKNYYHIWPQICTKFSISYNYCTIYSRAGQGEQSNGNCFGQEKKSSARPALITKKNGTCDSKYEKKT